MTRQMGIAVLALGVLSGCSALRDDMVRAENAYDEARYDVARVWLEDLEDDTPDMEIDMRARFYYLRGMTAYRLGHRNPALHYLALAREVSGEESSGALRPEQRQTMERTLAELTPQDATFHARGADDEAGAGGQADPSVQ